MFEVDATYQLDDANVAEDILWSSYFETRAVTARNRLVLFYAPLVKFAAARIAAGVSHLGTLDDFCQIGVVGLIDAIERFDPSSGYNFSTYAGFRIRGSILDGIREQDILPKRRRADVTTFHAARETLAAVFHRPPTTGETAVHLGRSVSDVANLAVWASRGSSTTSLSLLDSVGAAELLDSSCDPGEKAEREWTRESVKDALRSLTERQRQVLVLHYLEGFSKSDVAEILQIDRSRITQLIGQGLRNLKAVLDSSCAFDLDF